MILFAGALLLTPGFFTDAVGFALLTPPFRRAAIAYARKHVKVSRFEMGAIPVGIPGSMRASIPDGVRRATAM